MLQAFSHAYFPAMVSAFLILFIFHLTQMYWVHLGSSSEQKETMPSLPGEAYIYLSEKSPWKTHYTDGDLRSWVLSWTSQN